MPGNVNEGVHTFLVRVRNEDGSVREGIFIEDMGAKLGCNGVDNVKEFSLIFRADWDSRM